MCFSSEGSKGAVHPLLLQMTGRPRQHTKPIGQKAQMESPCVILQVVATVPFLLTGGTDSKHYQELCGGQTLRFMPVAMNRSAGDLRRIHGMDERVAEGAFLDATKFYIRFFQLALGSST